MPLSEVQNCLVGLRKNLASEGKVFFTFSEDSKPWSLNAKDYWFTYDQISKVAAAAGYDIQMQPDWSHFRVPGSDDQTMVMATLGK